MTESRERSHYPYYTSITTRWMDNDIYGHINNVTYYSFFDTVANDYLIHQGGLDIHNADTVGYIVASSCQYHASISHPANIEAGFRVNRLGNSSVEYGIGIFREGEALASANGTFTHVFVDRATDRATPIPDQLRAALAAAMPGTG
mgnify:CR=1 FL=1